SQGYRDTVEQAGVEHATVGPAVDPNDRELVARVMQPGKGSEVLVRELLLPHLERTYEELRQAAAKADLLLSHPVTYAAPVLAEREKLRWAATVLAPMLFFSVTDLPVFPQSPALAHARKLGPWVARALVKLAKRA